MGNDNIDTRNLLNQPPKLPFNFNNNDDDDVSDLFTGLGLGASQPQIPYGVSVDDLDEITVNSSPPPSSLTVTGRKPVKPYVQDFAVGGAYESESKWLSQIPPRPDTVGQSKQLRQPKQGSTGLQSTYSAYAKPVQQQQQSCGSKPQKPKPQQPVIQQPCDVKPQQHNNNQCLRPCERTERPVCHPPCDRPYFNRCTNKDTCNDTKCNNNGCHIYPYTSGSRRRRYGCFRVRHYSSSSSSCSSSSSSSCSSSSSSSCSSSSSSSSCSSSSSSSSSSCCDKKKKKHRKHKKYAKPTCVTRPCWKPLPQACDKPCGKPCGNW